MSADGLTLGVWLLPMIFLYLCHIFIDWEGLMGDKHVLKKDPTKNLKNSVLGDTVGSAVGRIICFWIPILNAAAAVVYILLICLGFYLIHVEPFMRRKL